jgi:hypothetical protein
VGVGEVGAKYEVLAERQKTLRLTKVDADGVRFSVERVDADGIVLDSASYAHDDFFDAIDEFDRRALDLFDPPVAASAAIMTAMINAVGGGDTELLDELLDDEFRVVDHRPIGLPALDRAEMIEATSAASAGDARYLTRSLEAVHEGGAVAIGGFWRSHFGEWAEYFVSAAIIIVEHSRVTLNELFPEEQLDAALARFAELTGPPDTRS